MTIPPTQRHLPIANGAASGLAGTPAADEREKANGREGADGEEKLLQVGDLAKACGKTVRAIHHYEEVGLLHPHARSKGRYRLYDHGSVARLRWIGKLHDLGLSLPQIQDMLKAWEGAPSAPGAMAEMRAIYQAKLEQTRAQIEHLASLERELVASIEYLNTCQTCDPAELVAACSTCNHHGRSQKAPDLVAGIHAGASCRNGGRP